MKKAIVIGATSGIGRELAKILSQNRYIVGVAGRRKGLLLDLQKEISNKSFCKCIDISQAVEAMEDNRMAAANNTRLYLLQNLEIV